MALIRRCFQLNEDVAAGLNRLSIDSGVSPDLLVAVALTELLAKPVTIDGRTYNAAAPSEVA